MPCKFQQMQGWHVTTTVLLAVVGEKLRPYSKQAVTNSPDSRTIVTDPVFISIPACITALTIVPLGTAHS